MKSAINVIKKVVIVSGALSLLVAITTPAVIVSAHGTGVSTFAAAKDEVCAGLGATGGTAGCDSTGTGLNGIIKLAVNTLSVIVGIAAIIMIMIGGFKYITSQGEASNTASAKNTILYALIGLIIVAMAQILVKFTLGRANQAITGTCSTGTHADAKGACIPN